MSWFRERWARLLVFFAVMGPGIITGNVDNDANGIATYSVAGASFGYRLLWTLVLSTVALAIVHDMVTRMGATTGKGLADLIRERFRVRATVFVMFVLVVVNWGNTVGDFAGIAGGMEIFGVSRYVAIPIAVVLVWLLVVRGSFRFVERMFLGAVLIYLTYVVSAVLARPPWGAVLREMVTPSFQISQPYLTLVVGLIGTTVAPWMQFYQQAAIVDKGIGVRDIRYARWDTYLGVISLNVVAFFIVVACGATLFVHGVTITTAADAAAALRPLAGPYAAGLFALGLLNASLFSVAIIPLSTAYAVCEAFGWEAGLDRSPREAPVFVGLFTAMILASAIVIMLPGVPLIPVMLFSQVLNGVLLPLVLVFLILLTGDREIMGRYRNARGFSAAAWVLVIVLTALSLLLAVGTLFG
jgi:NRAMP (natural resistance-associated macrophage protein)-like metal ion transporter